eukprot:m.666954 g.666954  ORF g.666954 m.666954 type:complete len:868 (-) comp22751_c0_seq25:1732-4335(-)
MALFGDQNRTFLVFIACTLAATPLVLLYTHNPELNDPEISIPRAAQRAALQRNQDGIQDKRYDYFNQLLDRTYIGATNRVVVTFTTTPGQKPGSQAFFKLRSVRDLNGEASDIVLHVTADGVLSACSAIHYFCLHYGGCTTTWGVQRKVHFPQHIPLDINVPRRARLVPESYYLNFCTPSYTMAFYNWTHWEQELDWMALHGVTMPLIITGRESIMRRLFREFSLTDKDILDFFTGPAFLAWHRMGNLKSWAGPIPTSFLDFSEHLTKRILVRARQLGMTPVLPAFSGHVPDAMATKFPATEFSRLPRWSGFSNTHSALLFVEPSSELYVTLGKRFIELQSTVFGTDHLYAVDQFNENDPRDKDPAYLAKCSEQQFQSLRSGDANATWIMQGWLFVFHAQFWGQAEISAYLGSVPQEAMIVLDLISEATPAYQSTNWYHGKRTIWNVLHNFGGQNGLRGNLQTVMQRPYDALHLPSSTMVGVGLTMEATNQNSIMYELTLDHAWEPRPRALDVWVRTWARARYGLPGTDGGGRRSVVPSEYPAEDWDISFGKKIDQAWQLLATSCYDVMDRTQGNGYWGVTRSVIEKRPSLNAGAVIVDSFQGSMLKYDACAVATAWDAMVDSARLVQQHETSEGPSITSGTAFELDVLDITRQVLSNHAQVLYAGIADLLRTHIDSKWTPPDMDMLQQRVTAYITLLDHLDGLLCMSDHFSFDAWLDKARALTTYPEYPYSSAERDLMDFNARNLVTLWGPTGQINDYSSRLWGGLIGSYYKLRWELALNATVAAVRNTHRTPNDGAFAGAFTLLWESSRCSAVCWKMCRPFAVTRRCQYILFSHSMRHSGDELRCTHPTASEIVVTVSLSVAVLL